eukprot:3046994-Pleurochrysis_carterae.AAC.1
MDELGLARALLEQPWSTLSGGESQRVYLCLNLALKPDVLLLDEVTSGCDETSALLVEKLVAQSGAAVIWISHDSRQVSRLGQSVLEHATRDGVSLAEEEAGLPARTGAEPSDAPESGARTDGRRQPSLGGDTTLFYPIRHDVLNAMKPFVWQRKDMDEEWDRVGASTAKGMAASKTPWTNLHEVLLPKLFGPQPSRALVLLVHRNFWAVFVGKTNRSARSAHSTYYRRRLAHMRQPIRIQSASKLFQTECASQKR